MAPVMSTAIQQGWFWMTVRPPVVSHPSPTSEFLVTSGTVAMELKHLTQSFTPDASGLTIASGVLSYSDSPGGVSLGKCMWRNAGPVGSPGLGHHRTAVMARRYGPVHSKGGMRGAANSGWAVRESQPPPELQPRRRDQPKVRREQNENWRQHVRAGMRRKSWVHLQKKYVEAANNRSNGERRNRVLKRGLIN